MLETSHLQCFVAVAQELHFGRAAARLHMTQPPLSRQIQLLERALGCEVFIRNSRSVTLTPAGLALLPEAQRALRLLETAAKSARDVAAGRRGTVSCGFTAASAYQFLPVLVRRMKRALPDASLLLREMVSKRQIAALDASELDVGFLRPPIERGSYDMRMVAEEDMVLAAPRGHRLLSQEAVAWRDLDGEDTLMYDPTDARYFYDLLLSRFLREGIHTNNVQHLTQIHTILSLVRSGVGLAVVPASARILDISDVEYRVFSDRQRTVAQLMVVWRRDCRNPLVPAIVREATKQASGADDVPADFSGGAGWPPAEAQAVQV